MPLRNKSMPRMLNGRRRRLHRKPKTLDVPITAAEAGQYAADIFSQAGPDSSVTGYAHHDSRVQEKKAIILFDTENWIITLKKNNFSEVDYDGFIDHISAGYVVLSACFYVFADQYPHMQARLKELGHQVLHVDKNMIIDSMIIEDLEKRSNDAEVFIVVSGDGKYYSYLQKLIAQGKEVLVVSTRGSMHKAYMQKETGFRTLYIEDFIKAVTVPLGQAEKNEKEIHVWLTVPSDIDITHMVNKITELAVDTAGCQIKRIRAG